MDMGGKYAEKPYPVRSNIPGDIMRKDMTAEEYLQRGLPRRRSSTLALGAQTWYNTI